MKRNLLMTLALTAALGAMADEPATPPFTPPFSESFNDNIGYFTTLDANNDGSTFYNTTNGLGRDYTDCMAYNGSTTSEADDWLFSPELTMQEGLVYEISFYYKTSRYGKTNKLEVKAGTAANVESMTTTLAEPFTIPQDFSFSKLTTRFTAPSDGNYVIGMHIISDADQSLFYIDDFAVAAGVDGSRPGAPAVTTPAFSVNGNNLEASFSITAPSADFGGRDLTGDVNLNIKRADSENVTTLTAAPGATVTYTDTDALLSATTYTVTSSKGTLESETVTVNASPQLGYPNPVEGFTVVQNDNVFTLSWEPVTEATYETALFIPSAVTYTIKCGNQVIAENIAGTSTTYTYPMPESGQDVVRFGIVANFGDKTSGNTNSGTYVVGLPIEGEFTESFANYSYNNRGWSTDPQTTYYGWQPSVGASANNINPQDGDNGVVAFALTSGDSQRLYSPKLDLSSLENAKLKFWLFMQPSSTIATTIQPGFVTDGIETLLGEPLSIKNADEDGWKEFTYAVPESAAAGVTQFVLLGKGSGSYYNIYLDNISIRSYLDHDLAVSAAAPGDKLNVGQQTSFTADILNNGANTESGYSVSLYAGEDLVTTVEGTELPADATLALSIPFTALPKYAGQDVDFRIVINAENDLDNSNNEASLTIPVLENDLTVPTGLTAISGVESVQLSWTAPEVSTEPVTEEVTESFEDWEIGATEPINGWVFIDADGVSQNGLDGINSGKKFAAMVSGPFTGNYSWDPNFTPYDGGKALCMTPAYSYGTTVDNWIISPEAEGGSTVTFYAQTLYNYTTSNTFDILSSAGGTTPEDFTVIETKTLPSGGWTEFSFTLPEDARRFAIHHSGTFGGNLLGFDKFTFTAYTAPAVLAGYNLYRDDAFVTTLPLDATAYADSDAQPNVTHTYNVTALYDKGESLYSEAATGSRGTTVGIDSIAGDLQDAEYFTLDGLRIDKPAKGQIVIVRRGTKVSKMIIK